jgi:nitrate/TMAO reductase-like tetraheme cytochrome c subunit
MFIFNAVKEGLMNIKQKNGGIQTKIGCFGNIAHKQKIFKV